MSLLRDICKALGLSPSEALYGFGGWLTTQDEPTVMSAHHDAADVAEKVGLFCETNELAEPREGFEDRLRFPEQVTGGTAMGETEATKGAKKPEGLLAEIEAILGGSPKQERSKMDEARKALVNTFDIEIGRIAEDLLSEVQMPLLDLSNRVEGSDPKSDAALNDILERLRTIQSELTKLPALGTESIDIVTKKGLLAEVRKMVGLRKQGESVYQQLLAAGVEMDNHESDLYAKVTPESRRIVEASGRSASIFTNEGDGTAWYDIPFAYDPWWEARTGKRARISKDYNGWANYETWNVNLWAMNDEPSYGRVKAEAPFTAESARALAEQLWPGGTPDMGGAGDMEKVDWSEVASAWSEEG